MKKHIFALAAAAGLALLLGACTMQPQEPVTVWTASDLHYLSPELTDYSENFMELLRQSDGKVTQYTPQITKTFVETALAAKPAAVILSGDLTLNGAPQSHRELAALLSPLREAGIKVLVIPGNHDISSTAFRFSSSGTEAIAGTATEDFAEIYADFGYKDALSQDTASLSYVSELPGNIRILLVDVNSYRSVGSVPAETLQWVEEQLKDAQKAKATVIAVSHQNLMNHNPRFTFGYEINNAASLLKLYQSYGVKLNLSGHLHLQNIAEAEGVTDIATASLAVTPNQFGMLTVSADRSTLQYDTCPLDVAAWAKSQGEQKEELLDFANYSAAFFDGCTRAKTSVQLGSIALSEEDRSAMTDLAVQMNRAYFGGTLTTLPDATAYDLWVQHSGELSFGVYLQSILMNPLTDQNHWNIALK